jgi:hypothetical protein
MRYDKNAFNLKLKFGNKKNKSYHKKRNTHWYKVTYLLLQPLNQRHIKVTSFGLSKSLYFLSVLLKYTNNFVSVCRIHETKFSTRVSFFCPLSICRATFNCSFDAQNLPFISDCSHVITPQFSS